MKQTIFKCHVNSGGITSFEHKVNFIYEPKFLPDVENLINIEGVDISFSIDKIVDKFTGNPDVQIRYIKLSPHEKQIL